MLPANAPVTDGFRCEAGSTGDATDKWILLLLGRDRQSYEKDFYRFSGGFQLKSFDCWSKSFPKEVKQICLGVKQ